MSDGAGAIVGRLQGRHEVVSFLRIPDIEAAPVNGEAAMKFQRMQGFTAQSISKNPREYSRQYVDEPFEQTDVVGYSPSIAFGFDKYVGNPVHDYIAEIIDNEMIGSEAVVAILFVDIATPNTNNATLRSYSVIADSEGDSMDAYTYSGNLRVKGSRVLGVGVVSDDGLTATFTPAS